MALYSMLFSSFAWKSADNQWCARGWGVIALLIANAKVVPFWPYLGLGPPFPLLHSDSSLYYILLNNFMLHEYMH